jgi:SAM-dependent methyltransferase
VDQLPAGRYDLAVATNLLVYLNDQELALALGNLAQALRPGGCLLHNDPRFAARLFGEAAGIPVVHFESVRLGTRAGREQLDRVVVHCKAMAKP